MLKPMFVTPTGAVPLAVKAILSLGSISSGYMRTGVFIIAVPFYQMTLGVDPFLLSVVLTIPLLISSIVGLYSGYLSDRCTSRLGRRQPFIIISAWSAGISFGCLWMVPHDWPNWAQLLYLSVCLIWFQCSVPFYRVPLSSLTLEITEDPSARKRLLAIISSCSKIASVTYQWAFPIAQLAIFGGVIVGVKYVGWGIGIFIIGLIGMLPGLLIRTEQFIPAVSDKPKSGVWKTIKEGLSNPQFRVLMFIIVLIFCGISFSAKMDYYLLVYYMFDGDLVQGSIWKGVLSSSYAVCGLLSIPFIVWLSNKIGSIETLKYIFALNCFGGILKWFIYTPGGEYFLVLDALLCSPIWASISILIASLIAEISEKDTKQGQPSRMGLYSSIDGWFITSSGIIAMLASGAALNLIGFDIELSGSQSESSFFLMRIILSMGTAILSLLMLVVLTRYWRDDERVRAVNK